MINNDKSKRNHSLGFILSAVLHGTLFFFLTYVSVDYIMPTGTVSSDEFVFTGEPIPLGDQTSIQQVEIISKNSPPPPPSKSASNSSASESEILNDDKSDVAVKKKKDKKKKIVKNKKKKQKPVANETEEVANEEESEDTEDFLNKYANEESNYDNKDYDDVEKNLKADNFEDLQEQGNSEKPSQQAYGASDGDRNARELKAVPGNVKPEYPMIARLRKISGKTILRFYVNPNGKVGEVQIKQSSGHDFFDEAAVRSKKTHKYYPGKVGWFEEAVIFNVKGQEEQMKSRLRR